jgi:hypothetical protein
MIRIAYCSSFFNHQPIWEKPQQPDATMDPGSMLVEELKVMHKEVQLKQVCFQTLLF